LLLRQQFFPADVQRLELAVMRPPNLGRPAERAAFLQALTRLESVPNCTGQSAETSQFWWRQWRTEANASGHGDEFERMDLDEKVEWGQFKRIFSYLKTAFILAPGLLNFL
jgi:hypothetical protein